MKFLYIFPHPDDESFGPAIAISNQIRKGNEVFLLTLTKGGATKMRFKYGYSIEEMGEVRYKEMLDVKKVLRLSGMTVLDLPDSGLKEMDPRDIEKVVETHIKKIKPHIVVTYPVHGISGFHDHLIIHGIVKRVYLELKDSGADYLKRLAFVTLAEPDPDEPQGIHKLHYSKKEEIDCIIHVDDEDVAAIKNSLACYKTYKEVIEGSKVIEKVGRIYNFEIFQENYEPPLDDLCKDLK